MRVLAVRKPPSELADACADVRTLPEWCETVVSASGIPTIMGVVGSSRKRMVGASHVGNL